MQSPVRNTPRRRTHATRRQSHRLTTNPRTPATRLARRRLSPADFLNAISDRIRGTARWMQSRYGAEVGLTADDFEQEGILAILTRVPDYDPDIAKPWTFAAPRVLGAMITAAHRNCRDVFRCPREIQRHSEEGGDSAQPAEASNLADRFLSLCEQIGAKLRADEADLLALTYGEGYSLNELAATLATTPHALTQRLFKIRKRIRAAAGPAGIAAFV